MKRYFNLVNVIALLMGGLMFIWPIKYTIAARNSTSALILILALVWWRTQGKPLSPILKTKPVMVATGCLAALTCWFMFQAIFIVPEADWVWGELRSQWFKDMVYWGLGLVLGAGCLKQQQSGNRVWLLAVLSGLLAIVLWNVVVCFWLWASTGQMPTWHYVTGARMTDSYVNNMLLAFLVGDLLARGRNTRFLPWSYMLSSLFVVLCLFNTAFIGARNGWIGLGMLVFSVIVVHYINGWRRVGKKALMFLPVLLALLVAGAWISWKSDSRWNSLKETLPIAWDIDTHKAWMNHDKYAFPVLPNGAMADESNYERPAWIHAGLRLVANRPLGAGFSRHAFGHELVRLYPENDPVPGMHAHSSMIDLAVGGGVPGVILWIGFIGVLVWFGGAAFFRHGSGAGLVLLFLTAGFFGRSVLDSNMRDHAMEQFIFIVAFLLPMVCADLREDNTAISTDTGA